MLSLSIRCAYTAMMQRHAIHKNWGDRHCMSQPYREQRSNKEGNGKQARGGIHVEGGEDKDKVVQQKILQKTRCQTNTISISKFMDI